MDRRFELDTQGNIEYACVVMEQISEKERERNRLRQQANYWRERHGRAAKRAGHWKEKAENLERVVGEQKREIRELTDQVEKQTARIAWLEQQVFGRKSEGTAECVKEGTEEGKRGPARRRGGSRKRGKQPGAKGYGRRKHPELPTEEVIHELPESKRICPKCGKPFADFPGTEDSEEIDYEERVFRRVHRRKRYRRTCQCERVPGIVAAPAPPKLIPKGKLSIGLWVHLLLAKYLDQQPLHRTLGRLALNGVGLSQGTITGGLRRIGELIQPLYVLILERSRNAHHWHMDETRWKVFAEWLDKKGHGWWLWIVKTKDTCVYLLDPGRSGEVPKKFLGENAEGVISADRYSAYKTLLSALIRIAYCWAHVRRDFLRIRDGYRKLHDWGTAWVDRIDGLFHRNARRLGARADPAAFSVEDQALRAEMDAIAQVRDRELADETLHPAARKALASLENHWEGLRIFVDHPEIPMDNNRAERGLRNPVIGRKNYYGSGSVWSGMFTVMMFTLLQTLLLNDINPKDFLQAYFEACAENGGRVPENLDAFLPWKSSGEEPRAA